MKLPRTLLFPVLVISSVFCVSQATTAPDVIFDEYGDLRWEDEKARLDNFTIPLLNDTDTVGYILVSNETNGFSDEAAARGLRAKRYVVERRGRSLESRSLAARRLRTGDSHEAAGSSTRIYSELPIA